MKILNLLNGPEGIQTGIEDGFSRLIEMGRIQDVYNFYFMPCIERHGLEPTLNHIIAMAVDFQPDAIILYHVSKYPFPRDFYRELKELKSRPVFVYDEHDGYERFRKPIPRPTLDAMAESDIISLCGLGGIVELLEKSWAYKICYTPHSCTLGRFDYEWEPMKERDYDVAVIANRITSRIPFKRLSGAKERGQVVQSLGECFGDRFAVFGRGWDDYVGNRGYLNYQDQVRAVRSSWITVGYDHCVNMSYYFSDRLPISLFAGVAHVCHYHLGYEILFEQGKDLVWFNKPTEAVDCVRTMLSRGREYLVQMGLNGRKASQRLSPEAVWGGLVEQIERLRASGHVDAASICVSDNCSGCA